MSKEHHIIYVPGLRDTATFNRLFHPIVAWVWRQQGFYPHVYLPHWEEGKSFQPKLDGIIKLIDELKAEGHNVSLIGQSAGGSAVLNAFSERRNLVNGVVNVTGRLRTGIRVKPSLNQATRISPAFKQSVLMFENQNEPTLIQADRRRIMTYRPWFDETVPVSTVPIEGATNLVSPFPEHSAGGGFICTVLSGKISGFLRGLE
jgi:pimeloyl-ACP methyl ester carboxylesterase